MKRFLPALSMLFLVSCVKEKYVTNFDNSAAAETLVLPAYSETGANTFGFLMNNSVFTVFGAMHIATMFTPPQWIQNTVSSVYAPGFQNRLTLQVGGRLSVVKQNQVQKEFDATFRFRPDSLQPLKAYLLPGSIADTLPDAGFFSINETYLNGQLTGLYYTQKPNHPFTVEILQLDTIKKICSGRFFGVLYDYNAYNSSDTLAIANGRFDVRYQQ